MGPQIRFSIDLVHLYVATRRLGLGSRRGPAHHLTGALLINQCILHNMQCSDFLSVLIWPWYECIWQMTWFGLSYTSIAAEFPGNDKLWLEISVNSREFPFPWKFLEIPMKLAMMNSYKIWKRRSSVPYVAVVTSINHLVTETTRYRQKKLRGSSSSSSAW